MDNPKKAGAKQSPASSVCSAAPVLKSKLSTPSLHRAETQLSKKTSQSSTTATSAATSAAPSPFASREPSPSRPPLQAGPSKASSAGTVGNRSRKNSQNDISPSRQAKTSSSTTSLSRTLSASSTPALLPSATETTTRAPIPQKPSVAFETSRDGPRWPISPRLRSPPPILNKSNLPTPRKNEEPPMISVQRSSPSVQSRPDALPSEDRDECHLQPGMRTPARSGSTLTLETVQEASPLGSALEKMQYGAVVSDPAIRHGISDPSPTKFVKPRASFTIRDNGSEGSTTGNERRSGPTNIMIPPLTSRQSSTSARLNSAKKLNSAKGEPSTQTMTVETETVTSIPQVSLAPGGPQSGNASLRTKPSSDTIRPKKDKKKSNRKQPTVTPGNASSKADIFEAKVASAVDEADTSDSEETFVYDSNPPDGRDRPQRFHSRTPSATSMVSQVDRNGMRSIHGVMEGAAATLGLRKNMKFVNSFSNNGNDSAFGDEEGKGSGRSIAGSGRGTARQHHHVNRVGRNQHPSIFDNESPFPLSAARSKFGGVNSARSHTSNPSSPKFQKSGRGVSGGRSGGPYTGNYDLDDTPGADDERTPLIGSSMRSTRSNRSRRHPISLRSLEQGGYRQRPSFLNRFAGCLVLTVMLMLVVSGAIGFMFATSQPLEDMQLEKISNVIASEQELMFDIMVKAHNPNVVVVAVDAAKLEIFAKSPHAGTDSEWWRRPHDGEFRTQAHDDLESQDESDDASPNLLLGRVTELDAPLTYEGSFFHHGFSTSVSGVRLLRPANDTAGGSERWERILDDDFELIVKGTLTYSLPLSQRIRSSLISGRTKVKPNSANDPTLRPNHTDPAIRIERL